MLNAALPARLAVRVAPQDASTDLAEIASVSRVTNYCIAMN